MLHFYYVCSECGAKYELLPEYTLCPQCREDQDEQMPLRGILEVAFDGALEEGYRLQDLICVEEEFLPPIPVGNTPLWGAPRLRENYSFPRLYLKDDTCNPTGSLKDRASYLVAGFARKHGIKNIVVASTGNAASSMAGIGAAAGLQVTLFIPESAPKGKLAQAYQYGAEVIRVGGTYDLAFEQSLTRGSEQGTLCRNTAYHPLTIEGKKSVALELFDQLGGTPDYIFVPTGDGVILSGVYKGFRDLFKLGTGTHMPTVYAVQAEGSSAITRAWKTGGFSTPRSSDTLADSISVDVPKGGYYALDKLNKYSGRCITVTDEEILEAQHELASLSGLFAEPASSAAFAGFKKERENLPCEAKVVLLITGTGLKDVDAALRLFEPGEQHE